MTQDEIPEVLDRTRTLCEEGQRQRAMEELFTFVHASLRDRRFADVDQILLLFEESHYPYIVGVGLLRACAAARQHLTQFGPCLNRVHSFVESQGRDPDRVLRGLLG